MKKQFKRGTNWSELKQIGKALCNPTTKALNKFNPKLLWIGRNQFGGGFREINNDLRCMSEIIDDELSMYYGYNEKDIDRVLWVSCNESSLEATKDENGNWWLEYNHPNPEYKNSGFMYWQLYIGEN